MEILTAKRAREIADTPFVSIMTSIEEQARKGNHEWNYKYYAKETIDLDLKRRLEELGYKVEEEFHWNDSGDYLGYEPYKEYTVKISW